MQLTYRGEIGSFLTCRAFGARVFSARLKEDVMQDVSSTGAGTTMDTDSNFATSAGKQLGLYALYALFGLSVLIYVLSVAAGSSGGSVSGGAINV